MYEISFDEESALKNLWKKRHDTRRKSKPKHDLVISGGHSARLGNTVSVSTASKNKQQDKSESEAESSSDRSQSDDEGWRTGNESESEMDDWEEDHEDARDRDQGDESARLGSSVHPDSTPPENRLEGNMLPPEGPPRAAASSPEPSFSASTPHSAPTTTSSPGAGTTLDPDLSVSGLGFLSIQDNDNATTNEEDVWLTYADQRQSRRRTCRTRKTRDTACLCGEEVAADLIAAQLAVECTAPGCETVWFHLNCTKYSKPPKNWQCEVCKPAKSSKRARR